MEGSCEDRGRQMGRLGETVKALELQAKELGFCPEGSGNPQMFLSQKMIPCRV